MRFLQTLSGRFLILTVIFVMLAEVLIFVPSVARFREDYLLSRLERAQIASLSLLADDMIGEKLAQELLDNAGVFNVVLRRDEMRQLILTSPLPAPVSASYDLRDPGAWELIRDAVAQLLTPQRQVIRVIGDPVRKAGLLIEVTLETGELRMAMLDYGGRIFILSLIISLIAAGLLFLAVRRLMVQPIGRVVKAMQSYAAAPEDARQVITPSSTVLELRQAEDALQAMQTQLTGALRQKGRLAQLGGAVAKISHDLRNILTSAQLFTDRLEQSEDPMVKRMAPKLVNSITRATHLCEGALAYGKAEEPAPKLTRFALAPLVRDVVEAEELAVGDGAVRLRADVPAQMMIRADYDQLHRVLTNLVRNARQAISAGGAAGQITVTAVETETDWQISVIDTGPGLPAKAQEHLFQPFQGRASKGGAGLGLSIAFDLVQSHGGRLRLVETGTEGTHFMLEMPRDGMRLPAENLASPLASGDGNG